jgi:2,5-dihydroxypyridine 5,6-dioxygenase
MSDGMMGGAEVIVRTCANVQAGETVAVITDRLLLPIARAVEAAVEAAGASPVVVVGPVRRMDNEPPLEPVAAAMGAADVVIMPVTYSLSHTPATRKAAATARVVSMAAFTEGIMKSGGLFADFRARRPVCDYLARRLTEASEVSITNPAGTDLTMSVEGRSGNSHGCIVDRPGFTAVPNIEANIAPTDGTANGVLVADGSIPNFGIGALEEPVTFEIEDGFVTSIEGGEAGRFLRDLLAEQDDPLVYNIAQFAMGLNPECKEFTGEMLNDEGVDGTIHIGIGTSANLGGAVQATTHFDAVIRSPTVWFDGREILVDGELTEEILAAAARDGDKGRQG